MDYTKFLVISQRAKASPEYNLKDLPGHGRFDIIARVILAATRPIMEEKESSIYCFLKGGNNQGWITWQGSREMMYEDEVSIAAKIQQNWENCFINGSLDELFNELGSQKTLILAEGGINIKKINLQKYKNYLIVLGAQNDLIDEDLQLVQPIISLSLGKQAMLASHAIILYRQYVAISNN